jgi:hypothetical protein
MTDRSKLFLVSVVVFVVIVLIVRSFDDCDEILHDFDEAKKHFNDPDSIEEIVLYKTSPGWNINLVKDTVTIRDDSTIRVLHKLVVDRAVGEWNHPVPKWNVIVEFKMTGGRKIAWRVSRISNSKIEKLTHIYPGRESCYDGPPEYSLLLGEYLEQSTGFTGATFE